MSALQPNPNRYAYDVFADYHQITLEDCIAGMHTGDGIALRAAEIDNAVAQLLNPQAMARHVGVYPGTLCILTARNMDAPLTVEVLGAAPQGELDTWYHWDHIVEASIDTPSGCMRLSGGAGMFERSPPIHLAAGMYRARVYFGGVYTVGDDDLTGSDHYRVVLWPGTSTEPVVLHSADTGAW